MMKERPVSRTRAEYCTCIYTVLLENRKDIKRFDPLIPLPEPPLISAFANNFLHRLFASFHYSAISFESRKTRAADTPRFGASLVLPRRCHCVSQRTICAASMLISRMQADAVGSAGLPNMRSDVMFIATAKCRGSSSPARIRHTLPQRGINVPHILYKKCVTLCSDNSNEVWYD